PCDVLPPCHITTGCVKIINKQADVVAEHPFDMKDAQKALKQRVNREAEPAPLLDASFLLQSRPHGGCSDDRMSL
ncbi:hypothetical protein N9L68_08805, partial [bacterium]|nr:hypothetical protein [bacterium]